MCNNVLTTFSISDIFFQKKGHLEVYFFQKKTTVSQGQGPPFFSVNVMIVNILFLQTIKFFLQLLIFTILAKATIYNV